MSNINYIFIKDNFVVNCCIFNNPSEELLARFKEEFSLDEIIVAPELIGVGWFRENDQWIPPKFFESWIWNGTSYEAPVPMPSDMDEKNYYWDENIKDWCIVI